jgi:phosphatidylserine decarboxylase
MKSFSTLPIAIKFAFLPFLISVFLFLYNFIILGFVFLLLSLFVFYFFRDPVRKPPNIPNAVLCPADGRILSIEKIKHSEFPNKECYRIKIFLSIFNVHIQRAPIKGNISTIVYNPGKFLNALDEKSSEDNENNLVGIEHNGFKIFVKQIAGIIARRIICKCNIGDWVEKGQKFGLICFGSRVEVFLPSETEIRIKPGMKVFAGKSILGIYHME